MNNMSLEVEWKMRVLKDSLLVNILEVHLLSLGEFT